MGIRGFAAALGLAAGIGVAGGAAQAAAIDIVAYATGGNTVIDFEDVAGAPYPGAVYDGLFTSRGATFGERFQGQTLTTVADAFTPDGLLDVLSGAPTGPLTLVAGAASQNQAVGADGMTNNLIPCGARGCAHPNGYGEGAFAVMFAGPVSYFGFQQLYGGGPGLTTLDFFNTGGGLIQRITVTPTGSFGFARAGGVKDIAGVSVFTTDPGGLGYDNLVYDAVAVSTAVPEPAAWALMIAGFGLAGAALRRRRTVPA